MTSNTLPRELHHLLSVQQVVFLKPVDVVVIIVLGVYFRRFNRITHATLYAVTLVFCYYVAPCGTFCATGSYNTFSSAGATNCTTFPLGAILDQVILAALSVLGDVHTDATS